MDKKRPAKIVKEKLPNKVIEQIKEMKEKDTKLKEKHSKLSIDLSAIQTETLVIFSEIKKVGNEFMELLNKTSKKMKLEKKYKDFDIRFDGKDSFVCVEKVNEEEK